MVTVKNIGHSPAQSALAYVDDLVTSDDWPNVESNVSFCKKWEDVAQNNYIGATVFPDQQGVFPSTSGRTITQLMKPSRTPPPDDAYTAKLPENARKAIADEKYYKYFELTGCIIYFDAANPRNPHGTSFRVGIIRKPGPKPPRMIYPVAGAPIDLRTLGVISAGDLVVYALSGQFAN